PPGLPDDPPPPLQGRRVGRVRPHPRRLPAAEGHQLRDGLLRRGRPHPPLPRGGGASGSRRLGLTGIRHLGLGLAAAAALGTTLMGSSSLDGPAVYVLTEAPTVRRRDRKNRKLREARNRRERRRLEAVRRERAGHERRARILASRGRRKAYMDLVD